MKDNHKDDQEPSKPKKKRGNPQNLKPRQKGQPALKNAGRPKSQLPELQEALTEVLNKDCTVRGTRTTAIMAILDKMVQLARDGNIRAAELMLNYAYGKPNVKVEHSVSDNAAAAGFFIALPSNSREEVTETTEAEIIE